MTTATQAKYTEEVKLRLWRRGLSVTALASKLRPKRHRNTVSQAIHHPNYFPRVVAQIKKELGIV